MVQMEKRANTLEKVNRRAKYGKLWDLLVQETTYVLPLTSHRSRTFWGHSTYLHFFPKIYDLQNASSSTRTIVFQSELL